ncbi:MAG: hypothetical protein BAA04_13515 [Firmicutes bacterium ZCTH02-B6]|nr:MAG: hypothetical protein BAA04_13515 [Firmicutes bacterium ZCTH02-B6]
MEQGRSPLGAAKDVEQRSWAALNEHDARRGSVEAAGGPADGGSTWADREEPRDGSDVDMDFFQLQWEAAEAAMEEERWQDAARLLERLLTQRRRVPPEKIARVQRRLAAVYVHQALQQKPLEGSRRNALQAVRFLEKAAGLDPGQPAPMYWCGVIYRWFGLWEKAADYFRRALEADPAHVPSRLELGWALLRVGDLEQLRSTVTIGDSDHDEDVSGGHLHRLRAVTLLAEGQVLEAFAAYPLSPPDGLPVSAWLQELLHLATAAGSRDPMAVLRRLGDQRHSIEMLLGAGDPDGEREDLRGRWRSLLHHLQATAAASRGDLDAAIAGWRQACEADPQDASSRQHLIYALVEKGNRDWRAGRIDNAVAAWAEARRRGGHDSGLLLRLALGYERIELWHEANQCWEEYLRLCPDGEPVAPRAAVLLAMAANAVRAGRRDDAQKLLARATRALEDRPDLARAEPYTWAGLLHLAVGNAQRAVLILTRALELAPGDERAIHGLLHAARLDDANQLHLIIGLRDAVARLPRVSWAYRYWRERAFELGRKLWGSGAVDQAMEVFASLLLADPGDIDAWVWAGTVHARKGNRVGAEDCFAEAIRLDPKRSHTYLDLGARFLAAGQRDEAMAYFEQAVKAAPGPETHVTIGELCAEIGVPDLAEHHFRASLTGGKSAEPLLVRAILGLVRTGYEDRVRPFLEEAYKQVPDSIQVRLLLAVQHLRHQEWVAADEALRQAEQMARERGAADLLAHAGYFRRSLILLRTIGQIDQESFREQVKLLLSEWLQASTGGPREPALPEAEPVESLLARLPAIIPWEPEENAPVGPVTAGSAVTVHGAAAAAAWSLGLGELPTAEQGDPGLFLRTVLMPLPVWPLDV